MKINLTWLVHLLSCLLPCLFPVQWTYWIKIGDWASQICHDNGKEKREVLQIFFRQQKQWNRGRHAVRVNTGSLSLSLLPTLPHSLSLHWAIVRCPPTSPSSGWDWSSSRWPQTGLGATTALVILCGFGCVTAAWLGYGTLITPPPGGLRVTRQGTSGERGKTLSLYMGIIPEPLSSGQFVLSTDNHF